MAHPTVSPLETTVHALAEMEKELDRLKGRVEDLRRQLLALAREEAERARAAVVAEAQEAARRLVEAARQDAEHEAQRILAEAEKRLAELRRRVEQIFDRAVDLVTSEVLGETRAPR